MPQQKPTIDDSELDAWLTQRRAGSTPAPVQIDDAELDNFLATTRVGGPGVGIGSLDPANAPKPRSWLDSIVESLPSAGGMIGGIVGGIGGTVLGTPVGGVPGAIGGAAVGGAGGEAIKQTIDALRGNGPLKAPGEAVRDITLGGAEQAAYEAGGQGLARGVLAPVSKMITKGVFKPTAAMLEKTPKLMTDIMEYGVGHSQRGVDKAARITTESRQLADEAISIAEQNGLRIPRSEILDATVKNPYGNYKTSLDIVGARAEKTPGLEQLGRSWDNVIRDNPSMMLPTEMQALKRSEGTAAKTVFDGVGDPSLQRQIHADYATGARNSLETRIPGLGAQNAETQKRKLVLDAVKAAVKNDNAATGITAKGLAKFTTAKVIAGGLGNAVGGPVGGVGLMAAHQVIANPRVAAAGARGMYQASKHPEVLANAIRGLGALKDETTAERQRRAEIQAYLDSQGR